MTRDPGEGIMPRVMSGRKRVVAAEKCASIKWYGARNVRGGRCCDGGDGRGG